MKMTLAEAEQVVLGWAVPANEAQIERSMYVTSTDLESGHLTELPFSDAWSGVPAPIRIDDGTIDPWSTPGPPALVNDVFIVVDASQRGMDLVYGESDSQERPGNCRSVSSRSRVRFRALFNASQGRYLGYQFLQYLEQPDELYARAARHSVNVVAMETPTPSATSTPSPSATDGPTPTLAPGRPTADLTADGTLAQPLATGEVPAPLVNAVREMAEVPGSYWVYRVTELNEGVHWSQRIFTDTISSSLQVAPDVILNQRNVPGASWQGSGREPWPNCYDLSHYLVFPNGRVAPNDTWSGPVKLADMRRLLPGPPEHEESGCRGQAVAALVLPFTENRTFSNPEDYWGTGERASIDVLAGHFEGCYAVHNGTGYSQPSIHWTCPGVGVVRHELPGCHMFGGGFTLYELIDYHIPPIVPAPAHPATRRQPEPEARATPAQ